MKLALSSMIQKIDIFSAEKLQIPLESLMQKSGEAVAHAVRSRVKPGGTIVILVGKGNNGGDGYATAVELMDEYNIKVIDVFGMGQNHEAGKYFLNLFVSRGGNIEKYEPTERIDSEIKNSDCIIDAVFGTGFVGEMPESVRPLAISVRESVSPRKIAIDVPLGINADNGSVSDFVINVEVTVALSYIKPGIFSYPARAYVGEIIYNRLGLPTKIIEENFKFKYEMIDRELVKASLPKRENNSNKGTFGKLLLISGSKKYRGAAHLTAESALRGGVGLVSYLGCRELISELSPKYPEIVYREKKEDQNLSPEDIGEICRLSAAHTATLIGSGSDNTEGLLKLTLALLDSDGGTLIIDADAINALSSIGEDAIVALKNSKRKVILTPHPLEFARLTKKTVAEVQLHRLENAEALANETGAVVVLKGAGTIITDGKKVFINGTGSSALAKAGSGDVLSGLIGAMCAQQKNENIVSAMLSVYLHAVAGDSLSKIFSSYGVTPSDLPKRIAEEIATIEAED